MKQITTIIFILLSLTIFAQTPTWQWIKAGGANTSLHQNNMNYRTKQIGTDAQGNVYGIASVSSAGIAIDTLTAVNGYGYDDFVVFSYSCEGDFRWMKMFGCFVNDIPGGIIVDKDGGVYISGLVSISPYGDGHIADSIIPAMNLYQKNYFIAKLDNHGNIVYINFPGPPVITVGATPIRMEADNQGNPVVLTWFSDSTTWNGFHVNRRGYYLVKFDKIDLSLMDIVELELKFPVNNGYNYEFMEFTIDANNDVYLFSNVQDTMYIAGDTLISDPINHDSLFTVLIRFNNIGGIVWWTSVVSYTSANKAQYLVGKPLLFKNHVFMEAVTQSYSNCTFLGKPTFNTIASAPYNRTKVYVSFDINTGNITAAKHIESKGNIDNAPISIYDNSLVSAGEGGKIVIINQNDTIKPYFTGSGLPKRYPFIISMDTGLTHFNWGIATKTLLPNTGLAPSCLHIDHNNNILLGGGLTGPITNTAGDTTNLVAYAENFCLAKIAITNDSCDCAVSVPTIAVVSSSGNTLIVKGFATNQPDSLYIFWGDGDSTLYNTSNTNISHTYLNTGPWNVCLSAYGFCGVEDTCLTNLYSGVYPAENNNKLTMNVYPNPFNERLNIELTKNINNGEIHIYDMLGKQIYSSQLSGKQIEINTTELKKGMYFIKLITDEGRVVNSKGVKN